MICTLMDLIKQELKLSLCILFVKKRRFPEKINKNKRWKSVSGLQNGGTQEIELSVNYLKV